MNRFNQDDWNKWMLASIDGDKAAYMMLLKELQSWLKAYFAKRTYPSAVPDLVQETLMSVHAKRHTFDPQYRLVSWVATIARNRLIDMVRRNLRYAQSELDENITSPDSDRELCVRHDLEKLLAKIPREYSDVIKLVKLQELSVKEAADNLGWSEAKVKIMVHRGLKRLAAAAGLLDEGVSDA